MHTYESEGTVRSRKIREKVPEYFFYLIFLKDITIINCYTTTLSGRICHIAHAVTTLDKHVVELHAHPPPPTTSKGVPLLMHDTCLNGDTLVCIH